MEQTTLYYRQDNSDKVYQASIEEKDGKYVVNFAYGRRGTTLQTGTKTTAAVEYGAAKAIYDKLIREKKAKGYTPGEDGTPYQYTGNGKQNTGIHCQLLNTLEEDSLDSLVQSSRFWAQEKYDGRRLLIQKQGNTVTGINRLGLQVALPETIVEAAQVYPTNFIIDGEAIGDSLYAFDALSIGGEDLRSLGFGERFLRLQSLLACFPSKHLKCADTACTQSMKAKLLEKLKKLGREGIVFKDIQAPYTSGRPSSGGPQLKYKFVETASFIVGKVNDKRSVSLLLFTGDKIASAGNVTIPPNHDIPQTGQVVECRYLYAFKTSGCIYQPVYLGTRDDIPAEECTTSQLKYKAEAEEQAA